MNTQKKNITVTRNFDKEGNKKTEAETILNIDVEIMTKEQETLL